MSVYPTTHLPLVPYLYYENPGAAIMWLSEAFGIVGSTTARAGAHVFVEDADAHRASARQAGAEIMEPPKDQAFGDRIYRARDSEGHEWHFAQHIRDVSIEGLSQVRVDAGH